MTKDTETQSGRIDGREGRGGIVTQPSLPNSSMLLRIAKVIYGSDPASVETTWSKASPIVKDNCVDTARLVIQAMRSDLGKAAYEISGYSSPGDEAEAAMLDWIDAALNHNGRSE